MATVVSFNHVATGASSKPTTAGLVIPKILQQRIAASASLSLQQKIPSGPALSTLTATVFASS
jgi:hypothetical protein